MKFFFRQPIVLIEKNILFSRGIRPRAKIAGQSGEWRLVALWSGRILHLCRRLVAASLIACAGAAPAAADTAQPLVSVQWLKEHLAEPDLVVLDIRSAIDGGSVETYRQGHIPGAVHSDYDKAGWRVARRDLPLMLPTLPELEKLIGELGIDEDSHVVVVPAGVHANDFGSAARTYWTLKVSGVAQVSILDGGFAAWQADGANAIETGINRPSPRIFTATLDKNLIAEVEEVEQAQRTGGATLVDARSPALFLGKEKTPAAQAYGHIPGALNIDNASLYDPVANRLKPKAELATIMAAVPPGPVVNYCNTGHWAATDWFVMSEILGRKNVKLFPDSMVEWSANASHPVASARTKWDDVKKVLGFGQ
jgi:thiosulfate/3-mercaptopyruvate sulfurtransferase